MHAGDASAILARSTASPRLRSASTSSDCTKNALIKISEKEFLVLRSSVLRSFTRSRAFDSLFLMYYVYILQSQKDKSYYTGLTEDLRQRIKEHNQHLADYSKSKAPFLLIWYGVFKDKKKAMDFEKYLKQGSGFAFARKRLV